MKKPFGAKKGPKAGLPARPPEESSLTEADYLRKKVLKKGINLMADEKLEEAAAVFETALRADPKNVDMLLKLGYSRFHLGDHAEALRVYDRVLEVDVANSEAWNLCSLVYYEQKKYAKALDAAEKAIDSEPTFGMAWYNKACYLSMLGQVPESLDALKRSIEIDVRNARKAVKDKDFASVRAEDGFRRIIQVVVLESVRQGYHTIGAIVWTTLLDKADVLDALQHMQSRGLIVQNEKRSGLHRIPTYDLAPDIAKNAGGKRRNMLGMSREIPAPVMSLKEISSAVQKARAAVEEKSASAALEAFEPLIDSARHGQYMIENFFEGHREIRLWKIRLADHGDEYIHDNGEKMSAVLENIDATITKQLRGGLAQAGYSAERSQ